MSNQVNGILLTGFSQMNPVPIPGHLSLGTEMGFFIVRGDDHLIRRGKIPFLTPVNGLGFLIVFCRHTLYKVSIAGIVSRKAGAPYE